VQRRGETRLVVDITWKKKDGTQGRYRHDAEVQTMAAARAEQRRVLANIAQYGDAYAPVEGEVVQTTGAEPYQEQGKTPEPTTTRFTEAVEAFQRTTAITKLKPSSRLGYDEVFRTRLIPALGDLPIGRIGLDTMTELDAGMVKEGLSASRRRNVLICIRSVLRDAHRAGRLAPLPAFPPLPKKGTKVLVPLRREQVEAILAASPPAWRLAFALAAYAGLRAGEVRALRWLDVDLVAPVLVVRLSRSKGQTSTPKSGHEREVPIAEALAALLNAQGRKAPRELVAVTSHGEPWKESGLLQAFRRAQKKAGLSGFRYHDLRHFFVTELFRGGAAAPAVQALAGHLHLSTTEKYAHMVQSDLRATIRILDARGNSVVTAS
jgi:integrase